MLNEADRQIGRVVVDFHIQVQQLVEIERLYPADGHAQGVAKIVASVMVFQKGRVFRKDRALVGCFHIVFQGHQSLAARFIEQVIDHFQRIQIALFGEL